MRLWRLGRSVPEWVDYSTLHFDIPVQKHEGSEAALRAVQTGMQPADAQDVQPTAIAVFHLVPHVKDKPGDERVCVLWRRGSLDVGYLSDEASAQLNAVLLSLWARNTGVSCLGQVGLTSDMGRPQLELMLGLDVLELVARFVLTEASGVVPARHWSRPRSWMTSSTDR